MDEQTQDPKSWFRSQVTQNLAGAVALKTILVEGEPVVNVYFSSADQTRKVQALCEGYFNTKLGPYKKAATVEQLPSGRPALYFQFQDMEGSHQGADFIKEFGKELPVITRDANRLEAIPTTGWNGDYKTIGPGWRDFIEAEKQVDSLLASSQRVLRGK